MNAHPTAVINKKSHIDESVQIGPYAIIEDGVKIGKNVKIYAHAYICSGTEIGEGTEIHMGAVIGHEPQDFAFKGKKSYLKIGKKNIIREYVTIHRGTEENSSTEVGDENFIMGLCHIGHNCRIGNKVIMGNAVLLAGHVSVEDGVFLSGGVVVHQFCKIGKLCIIGGFSGVNRDIPPYLVVRGPSRVRAVNIIGLRRAGFKSEIIREIKEAFRLVYRSDFNTKQALEKIMSLNPGREVMHFVDFIKNSKRGIGKYTYTEKDKEDFG